MRNKKTFTHINVQWSFKNHCYKHKVWGLKNSTVLVTFVCFWYLVETNTYLTYIIFKAVKKAVVLCNGQTLFWFKDSVLEKL